MRIGIISPCIMFREFSRYFSDEDRLYLENLIQNENGPAPSVIAHGFIKIGHFVRVFTIGSENRICKSSTLDIVTINPLLRFGKYIKIDEFRNAMLFAYEINKYIKDLDVLHAQWSYYTALSASFFCRKLPVFCTVRDWTHIIRNYLPNKGGLAWMIKQLINDINLLNRNIHFIGNSPYTKYLIERRIGRSVCCIMNPINDDYIINTNKMYPDNLRLICISSSIDKRKNIGKLLSAYKMIKKSIPNSSLTCLFGYADRIENNQYYKEYLYNGLLDDVNVIFGAKHNDVFRYIDDSTMLVNPSLEETFGNTIIESMARKTPVIAGYKSGAIPYLIGKSERGYLCDVSSEYDIFKTIIYAYNNIKETIKKSENAYNFILKNNTLSAIAELHIQCYNSAFK